MNGPGIGMIPQPEILEHLKTIPSLRDKPCKLYSWPEAWRPEFEQHYAEWARITGSWPISWRWESQEDVDRRVELCLATDANICLHVSPDWPVEIATTIPKRAHPLTVDDAIEACEKRWELVDKWVNHRVDFKVVFYDLEGCKYKPGDHGHNDQVAKFNRAIYEIAKEHVGSAEVRRYNHLSVHDVLDSEYGGVAADMDTSPFDPVDGFGVSLYNVIDTVGTHRDLTRTIENAKRYKVNRGTAWIALGGAMTERWLCPGAIPELDEHTDRFGILPYDPQISYDMGGLFGNTWYQRDVHGQSQRNSRFPKVSECDVCLWPGGPFRKRSDRTSPQFLAFLYGFQPLSYADGQRMIEELRKLQVKYWKEGR